MFNKNNHKMIVNNNNNNINSVCHRMSINGLINGHKYNAFHRTNHTNCVPIYLILILFIFTTFTSGMHSLID